MRKILGVFIHVRNACLVSELFRKREFYIIILVSKQPECKFCVELSVFFLSRLLDVNVSV